MNLLGSSEILAGIILLILWVIALRLFRSDRPLSTKVPIGDQETPRL